jgi:hypothetical protein
LKLRATTHADMRRIRLRSEAALPYQGIPAKPAQPAKRTRTGIQAKATTAAQAAAQGSPAHARRPPRAAATTRGRW